MTYRIRCFYTALLLLILVPRLQAQKDYSAVDAFAKHAPPGISRMVKPLTHYLTDRYSSEEDKARSIAVWIAYNIKYDVKMYRTDRRKKLSPNKILQRKKAICQGYCDLFEAMCKEAGLTATTITGYDKGGTYEPQDIFVRDDHAWSAVNTGGGWHLLDLTWSAGYVVPRRQAFRRWLYFTFDIPFTQKYRFIRHVTYDYYYTEPGKFAKDHLPAYPWWQMTDSEISIDAFEKDTVRPGDYKTEKTEAPHAVSIPDFESSTEPVAYLKQGKAAFKFNPKNYRILSEKKAMYAYTWFLETKKSKSIENKTKVEAYDSCKTVIDEAKDADKEYMRYTGKERVLRVLKNKDYHKASVDFNKEQKNRIRKETQLNFRYADQIEKQIAVLKKERSSLQKENTRIGDEHLPEKKKNSIPDNSALLNNIRLLLDSIASERAGLETFFQRKDLFLDSLEANKKATDSVINHAGRLMNYKMFYRYYFDWNHKDAVDTLQLQHAATALEKDSLIFEHDSCLRDLDAFSEALSSRSDMIRGYYRQRLSIAARLYAYSSDSAGSVSDSFRLAKSDWRSYNNRRQVQLDEQILDLKSEKRSVRSQNRKLRRERKNNDHEIAFERFRYKYYNRHYRSFYKRERKKAVSYLKALIKLKSIVQQEEKYSKEKIKEEERKAREEAEKSKAE